MQPCSGEFVQILVKYITTFVRIHVNISKFLERIGSEASYSEGALIQENEEGRATIIFIFKMKIRKKLSLKVLGVIHSPIYTPFLVSLLGFWPNMNNI